MRFIFIQFIVLVVFVGCSKHDDKVLTNSSELYVGTWVNSQFTDSVYIISRSNDFVDNQDGFRINADGTFVQRINSGGCATPPISYANYPGSWTLFPDNTLFIESENWRGVISFEIEIVEVDKDKMVYKTRY